MKFNVSLSGSPSATRSGVELPLTISTDVWVKFATVHVPWTALVDPHVVEGINAQVSIELESVWRKAGRGSQLPLELWE